MVVITCHHHLPESTGWFIWWLALKILAFLYSTWPFPPFGWGQENKQLMASPSPYIYWSECLKPCSSLSWMMLVHFLVWNRARSGDPEGFCGATQDAGMRKCIKDQSLKSRAQAVGWPRKSSRANSVEGKMPTSGAPGADAYLFFFPHVFPVFWWSSELERPKEKMKKRVAMRPKRGAGAQEHPGTAVKPGKATTPNCPNSQDNVDSWLMHPPYEEHVQLTWEGCLLIKSLHYSTQVHQCHAKYLILHAWYLMTLVDMVDTGTCWDRHFCLGQSPVSSGRASELRQLQAAPWDCSATVSLWAAADAQYGSLGNQPNRAGGPGGRAQVEFRGKKNGMQNSRKTSWQQRRLPRRGWHTQEPFEKGQHKGLPWRRTDCHPLIIVMCSKL